MAKWTKDEIKILKELSSKIYYRDLAIMLNRSNESVYQKIRAMNLPYVILKREYSNEEIDFIKNNWGILNKAQIARSLKITRNMLNAKAKSLNLPKINPTPKWDTKAIEKLRQLAKDKTISELANYFNTTVNNISTIAYQNKIKLKHETYWSDEEIKLLKQHAPKKDLSELAEIINKSTSAIRLQAESLNIPIIKNKKSQENAWTIENTNQLIVLANKGKTLVQIAKIMNKKDRTITKKAQELGLKIKRNPKKNWNDEETQKLIELAKIKTLDELVQEFNCSSDALLLKAKRLNINIISENSLWTEEEYDKLEKLLEDGKDSKEIAKILNRSEDAVIIKISRRHLQNTTAINRHWTKEDKEMLKEYWGRKSIEYIAQKLNRSVSALINMAYKLKLGDQFDYDGLKIQDICELFKISRDTVTIGWVALGLKISTKKITKITTLYFVKLDDLYYFLEQNQDIWDSRLLEKNILGIEPEWLKEKRKRDNSLDSNTILSINNLIKRQLLQNKKTILEQCLLNNKQPNDNILAK